MAYIGNQTTTSFTSLDKQTITGDGGTAYTLSHAVANAQEIEVFVNNVRQEPGVAYTVSGTALTMTGNVTSTDDFYVVFQGKAIQSAVHPSDHPLNATTGTFTGDLTVDTNTLHVDAANNRVGIGLTAPSRSLHMKGSAPAVRFEDTDQSGVYHEIIENSGQLDIRADQGNTSTTGNMLFKTGGTERMRLLAGGGLTFNGDTAAANALDDYEEGTWTPAPQFGGNSAGMTFDHGPTGYYTKVGRMVFVWFGFRFSNKGTSVGAFRIRGLPYSIANTAAYTHPTNIAGGVPSANTQIFQALGSGDQIIYRRLDTTADDAADELDFNNGSGWFGSLVYHTS